MTTQQTATILALTALAAAGCAPPQATDRSDPEDTPVVPGPMGAPGLYPPAPGAPVGVVTPGFAPAASADEWTERRVKSGARLRAIFASTSDGGRFFQFEWYDTTLGARCRFALAGDGQSRCLPLPPRNAVEQGLIGHYRDATCGEALLAAEQSCSAGYGTRVVNGLYSIHRLGPAQRLDRAFALEPNAAGQLECRPVEIPGGQEFFTLGTAVPPESFVATSRYGAEPVTTRRIWPIVRSTSDGMRVRTGWWDSRLAQECSLRRSFDGVHRCLPQTVFRSPLSSFADAACTQPAAVSSTSPDGTLVRVVEANTCPTREVLYGTEVIPGATTVYRKSASGCLPVAVPAGARVFVVRQLLADSEFVAFNETRAGAGRLQQRLLSSAEGAVERPSYPVDTSFSDTCGFARSEGGKLFCLPLPDQRPVPAEAFGDAGCSSRVARPAQGLECAQTQHASLVEGTWCAPLVRTKLLGAPAAAFRRGAGIACQATGESHYRALGVDVSAASFVEGTDVME